MLAVSTIACAATPFAPLSVRADTLEGALVQAYQNNPSLNAQRAAVRATDEGVPQALSGYRPKVTVGGTIGQQYSDTTTRSSTTNATYSQLSGNMTPNSYGITATQTLYNGFQTSNKTRQAESQVQAARESLADKRAGRAAQRGDGLHEPVARWRDPRSATAQRRGACRSSCARRAIVSMSAR